VTRVGIVGLGFGEGVHVPGFRALDGVDVVVVCGREPERTRALYEDIERQWPDRVVAPAQ